jgi:hypothetical protein
MSAREVFFGGWILSATLILLPLSSLAQCDHDVPLALGGHASTPSSQAGLPSPGGIAPSEPPAAPSSKVSGASAIDIAQGVPVRVTEAEILALPISAIVTATDWTPVSRFEGPLLSEVLKLKPAQAQTQTLHVYALNDYAITIPVSDIEKYAPILAHTRDGVRMKRSDFGPLFIVYPRDRYRELRTPSMVARMAWQVCRIDVE